MKDELKRSMVMRDTGYDKPFFISYGITDLTNFTVYSSLGAVIQSGESGNRGKSVRVLVGNYEFNDESLDNNTFSEATGRDIQLPVDDDYYGIRRALWTSTDVVYRGAAQKYRTHQNTLNEQKKALTDLPHRTFAKVPVVTMEETLKPASFDKAMLEDYCRKVSAVFTNYPGMESSDVMLSVTRGANYFVNSEGTSVIKPYRVAVFQCRGQIKTSMGEPVIESFVKYVQTPDQLPPLEKMIDEATAMAKKLQSLQTSPALEEEYSGPVLFLGSAVSQVFSSALFSFKETLVATNAILSTSDFRPEAAGQLDSRIGKLVIDNGITIKAKAKLKKFGSEALVGAYEVDDEGVVPPNELILIDKGILKNQLNDRSLAKPGQSANGHAGGPAVIEVTSSKQISEEALKATLIDMARREGLEFAIIVRESGDMRANMSEVWKVNLENGEEELLKSAQVSGVTLKELRKIGGMSDLMQSFTVPAGEGTLSSFICPSAMLLERIDVVPLKLPYLEQEIIYVPSPLKR